MASAWLDFSGFKIYREQNKITEIKVLNTESDKEEDFITFSALLRYFLNKNNFDTIYIELTKLINENDEKIITSDNDELNLVLEHTKTYYISLKSVIHDHKRYLEIETHKCFFYADYDTNKEKYFDVVKYENYLNERIELKLEQRKIQIPEYRAQIWLEALNKYHI